MNIHNDKELFKLRDDILAGNVVMVTKNHFDQLESLATSRPDLLTACEELIANYERDAKATKITGSPNVQYALELGKAAIAKAIG